MADPHSGDPDPRRMPRYPRGRAAPRWPAALPAVQRYRHRPDHRRRAGPADPQLVASVAAAGHQVANHTFTHAQPFARLTAPQVHDEIARTSDVLAGIGIRPRLFRAPGGEWSPATLGECAAAGLRPLDWSVDPRDWSRPGVRHIVETILTRTRPGAIILDHDGGGDRQQTLDALTIALPRLLDAGYHFVQP
ncbi:MAG: polysaccharide deacetylase family protein [Actinobacteria bacterium]|nr:MAG: polysaccharide deacetylase family protein [Actinomycetota bacterium]